MLIIISKFDGWALNYRDMNVYWNKYGTKTYFLVKFSKLVFKILPTCLCFFTDCKTRREILPGRLVTQLVWNKRMMRWSIGWSSWKKIMSKILCVAYSLKVHYLNLINMSVSSLIIHINKENSNNLLFLMEHWTTIIPQLFQKKSWYFYTIRRVGMVTTATLFFPSSLTFEEVWIFLAFSSFFKLTLINT